MFLRNHGVVCCGRTIEIFHLDEDTRARVYEQGMRGGGGVNISKKDWGVGELEFEALMRMLDNSVRTLEQQNKNQFLKKIGSLKHYV